MITGYDLPTGQPSTREFALETLPLLKREIVGVLWDIVDRHPWIQSGTLTGSFLNSRSLEGISDIDFIIIVDKLNALRFRDLQDVCTKELGRVLAEHGWSLRLNTTLGPLKFNEEKCAVLHLMAYSTEAHVEHVIQSPFTCFDWQLSPAYRGSAMAEVYPTFALQPRHFMSARRSISDYLNDYRARVISYRELECSDDGYAEITRHKPMTVRDQHEFAYHIIRFLMRNVVKLLTRNNVDLPLNELLTSFFQLFPDDELEVRDFFGELCRRKQNFDFTPPAPDMDARLERFMATFETQFRGVFSTNVTRHVLFRHGETPSNLSENGEVLFLGRSDPSPLPIAPEQLQTLRAAVDLLDSPITISSPLLRCRDSLRKLLPNAQIQTDQRLIEIDYGDCEGLSVLQARNRFPFLFEAWDNGHDPMFPGGESTQNVAERVLTAVNELWESETSDTLSCTHNVVLRALIGTGFGVPKHRWHKLRIPHLQPISVIKTRRFGWFIDLDPEIERGIFSNFVQGNASE